MNELKSERYSLDGMPGISHGSEKISLQRNALMFSGNIMYSALFLTVTIFFISIHTNVPLVMLKNLCRTKVAFYD